MLVIEGDVNVFGAVIVEPGCVVLLAVDLHPDRVIDHEVYALEVTEGNLGSYPVPGKPKPGSRQAFGEGLTGGIDPCRNTPALLWQRKDEGLEVDEVERCRVKRPIQSSDRGLEVLVENDSAKSVHESHRCRGAAAIDLAIVPVQHDAAQRIDVEASEPVLLGPQTGCIVVDRDMQRMIVQHPGAERNERRNPGEPAADPDRPKGRVLFGER